MPKSVSSNSIPFTNCQHCRRLTIFPVHSAICNNALLLRSKPLYNYKNIYPRYLPKCHTISHTFLHLPNVLNLPEYNLHMQCGLSVHVHFIITNSMEQNHSQTAHSSLDTQENFCSIKNPNIHYHVYNSPSLYFFHIHITSILPPMPPLGLFLLTFWHRNLAFKI
jgi:hypothetical protein